MRSFTRVDRPQRSRVPAAIERVKSNSCLLTKLRRETIGNVRFICGGITLLFELLYNLRDCLKEIRYQSDVCYLEYGSVWVLQNIITSERGKDMVRKESTLFIATMSFESFIPARCWIAPEMPTAM